MSITLTALMKQRYDTAANWTAQNPTLLAGEFGIESDTKRWKVGDGATAWTSLLYSNGGTYPLVNADIAAAAGIVDTKLATIATAGKVSNSATTAASANTASAIVARDASGNFTAGTITAALTGNAATVTTNANLTGDVTSVGNATAIAAGVIVNADINASAGIVDTKLATIATALKVSNSATTAASANTASAIVARDASGNFTAGTITCPGIAFPATQVASANANTLDDYEEGTWTPTVIGTTTAGTVTYAVQNARYTKIGRVVSIEILLNWSAGTGTGNFRISGLPFTSGSSVTTPALALAFCSDIAMTASHILTARVADNSTQIEFLSYPSGGGTYATVVYDAAAILGVAGSYSV